MTIIQGTVQNDTLYGTAGNDIVDGLAGTDTLVFATPSSGATFSLNAQGQLAITSAEGQDTLTSIEQVQFSDGVVTVGNNDTRVNTSTANNQSQSAIALLADGSYVVTWSSGHTGQYAIYSQHYAADGSLIGGETRINTTTAFNIDPAIAALGDGGYLVTWTSNSTDVYAQRYAADGSAVGVETRINTTTADNQFQSSIAGLADGGYVVTWTSNNQDGYSYGVYAQRYAADGSLVGAETRVNTTTQGAESDSDVAVLVDGGYVVTWTSYTQDGNLAERALYAQRYAADGSAVGAETRVNIPGTNGSFSDNMASHAALADGGYVVTWTAWPVGSANRWDVYAQRYAADGSTAGGVTLINTGTAADQIEPDVAALADGGYVITWRAQSSDNSVMGIYAQRFAADGSAVGGEMRVGYSGNEPTIAALADGGFVISWTSYDNWGTGVYSQRFNANGLPELHPTLTGGVEDNVLRFSGSVGVQLNGGEGNDTLAGGSGTDVLVGGGGLDTFEFASSNNGGDRITDWGTGDRIVVAGASFANDPTAGDGTNVGQNQIQASTVNGVTTLFIGTDAVLGADVVIQLQGSWEEEGPWAADQFWASGNQIFLGSPGITVTGNSSNNSLAGGDGNDTLDGGAGRDTMAGGLRSDTYIVDNTGDVVVEAANAGTDLVSASVSYTLAANVENLSLTGASAINATGNALNNVLEGNGAANVITGGLGADTMTGGLGADRFVYASAAESSGAGWDVIVDFTGAQGDRIDLSKIDANATLNKDQAFTFIGSAAFSANATGQLRFDSATHMLYGSTNADATAELAIELTGVVTLNATDIIL